MKHKNALLLIIVFLFICSLTISCNEKEDPIDGNQNISQKDIEVIVYPDQQLLTSKLLLSTTLTHRSFSHPQNTEAVARAESYLEQYTDCLAQFTMDWGAGNTNPAKNEYNFKYLDRSVERFQRLGRKIVLTLCRCPEWMRRNDPSKGVDAAPRVDMYEEFGHMSADIIRHYKKKGINIFAINVWSETRGYWSKELDRWFLEDYADLYNIVYDSIKNVDSQIMVGGPFMHIESSPKGRNMALWSGEISSTDRTALKAFIDRARRLDFFAIDRNLKENNDLYPYHNDTILRYTQFNETVHRQCRELLSAKFPDVPIWVVDNQCLKGHYPEDLDAAGLASMFRWHLLGGAGFVDKWQPEDEGHERTDPEQIAPEGMYTHTDSNGGAQPLPTLEVFKDYKSYFPAGTVIVKSTSSNEFVEPLASTEYLMLINKQSTPKSVTVKIAGNGSQTRIVELKRYEVKTLKY
ncbi:hypothetical protein SDC9_91522 [bioreactor metagenome]|uniref:Glycoside hydrolase family 42 N-terminal domain-containing protein n=1 Tax=bioreactor metagenome TaxID=1076179 RepID=A0A644ZV59_9ZZZZ